MLREDVQEWEGGGRCEAGLPVGGGAAIEALPACDKRARWLVSGALLCGGCKRALNVEPYLTRGQRNAHHRGLA